MEYTEFADYPTPSGVITEWVPSTTEAAWVADARPLSTNHAAHLRHTRDDDVSWIGTAFGIDAPLDGRAFATTLRLWLARHEAFRVTAVPGVDGLERRRTEAESIAVDVTRFGRVRSSQEVYRHIEGFLADKVRAHTWPHLVVATVEHAEYTGGQAISDPPVTAGFTVVFGADHAVMDAYTQLLAIAELREIYRAVLAGDTPALPPCGSYVDHSAAEYLAAAELDRQHPAVVAWDDYLGGATGTGGDVLPAFGLPLQPTPAPEEPATTQASLSRWILTREQTDAFAAACKAAGASATTGALTAVAVALARLSGSRTSRYIMPMHTRTSAEWFAAAGWFVGLIPVHDDLADAASFTEALAGTTAATRRHRSLVEHSFARIAELLDISPRPRFVVSLVDGRALPGAADWTPHDRALRSPVRSDDELYLWINRTADGINLSTRFPGNDTAAAAVHAFIAEFSTILADVAAHGDVPIGAPARTVEQVGVASADGGEER